MNENRWLFLFFTVGFALGVAVNAVWPSTIRLERDNVVPFRKSGPST